MSPKVSFYEKYDIVMKDGCMAAGIESYTPYTRYLGGDGGGNVSFDGTCITLVDIITQHLGICYSLLKSPNGLWGIRENNGSWNGLVGLAQRAEIEMIICPIVRNFQRFQVMDFSEAVSSTDYTIVYPRPKIEPNFFSFLIPLTFESWLLLVGTVLILMFFSGFVGTISPIAKLEKDDPYWKAKHGFNLDFNWAYTSLVLQPLRPKNEPIGFGGRVLMGTWLLVTVILGVVYRCNFKALLIVPQVTIPFDNLEGLVNQDKIQWAFLHGSIIPLYFEPAHREEPNSVMGLGWSKKGELYSNVDRIPEFVIEKKMACIEITEKIVQMLSDDFSQRAECRFAIAKESLITIEVNLGYKKHSRLRPVVNKILDALKEGGIIQKILFEKFSNYSYCSVKPGDEVGPVTRPYVIRDFGGTYCLLFGGCFISVISFIIEHIVARKHNIPKIEQIVARKDRIAKAKIVRLQQLPLMNRKMRV